MFCAYPPGQQNDRGKRWHCKEIQQLGGTQGTVPCVRLQVSGDRDNPSLWQPDNTIVDPYTPWSN